MQLGGGEDVFVRVPLEKRGQIVWPDPSADIRLRPDAAHQRFNFIGFTPEQERGLRAEGAAFYIRDQDGTTVWRQNADENCRLR